MSAAIQNSENINGWLKLCGQHSGLGARFGETPPSRPELLRYEAHIYPGCRAIFADIAPRQGELCGELLGRRFITPDMALALIGAGLAALSELALPWQKEIREARKRQGAADALWVQRTLAILDANIRSRIWREASLPGVLVPLRSLADSVLAYCLDDWLQSEAPQKWVRHLASIRDPYGSAELWARASHKLPKEDRDLILAHRSARFRKLFEQEAGLLKGQAEPRMIREAWNTIIHENLVPLERKNGWDIVRVIDQLREDGLLARQLLRINFCELAHLSTLLPKSVKGLTLAELPRTLQDALAAWASGELIADFLITKARAQQVQEYFIRDALFVFIIADYLIKN
ncbi:MAG: hypothetical protein LBC99_08195 [Spirochaetota bacterium]|jgi:hypothetical protein|nr:hypothetical protein [Spirochaetota bacterium]